MAALKISIVGARGARVSVNPMTLGPDVKTVAVSVEVPMAKNGWIVPRFTSASTMRSVATMRTERTGE